MPQHYTILLLSSSTILILCSGYFSLFSYIPSRRDETLWNTEGIFEMRLELFAFPFVRGFPTLNARAGPTLAASVAFAHVREVEV